MNLAEYQEAVSKLAFGKRLPGATYIFQDWTEATRVGHRGLEELISHLKLRFELGPEFNVLKFRNDELKVSFLSYGDFMENPHPALHRAVTIDLAANRARRTDYADNLNPPILHRKELFLPADHPQRAEFAALTQAEESAGLYEETSTIGFKLNWEHLLAKKRLAISGHQLLSCAATPEVDCTAPQVVDRHKTALTRYDLSKPVKTLLEFGLLKPGVSVFDYGCGQGSDIRGLTALGHEVAGWDPVHRPEGQLREADIVNLGFVLNVFGNPAERVANLIGAHRLARLLLVVTAFSTLRI